MAAGPAFAGTLSGVVRNGSTGQLAPGQEVVLLQLQGGMQPVATTKTDPHGRYSFNHPEIGRGPMLVRVPYRGVNYHKNVTPDQAAADVEVFENSAAASDLQMASRLIVFQPRGDTLLVGEEFSMHNHSKPPATFNRPEGTFEFFLPEGGGLIEVSAWGPAGMPVVQGTINRGPNRFAIAFPLRPAENGIRLSYQLPYKANQAALRTSSPYAAQRVLLLARPTMQVESAGFAPAGNEQGWNVYARDAVPAGEAFSVSVSGTAPPEDEAAGGSQGRAGAASASAVQVVPGRLESLKWILIAGFAALFALGAIFLWRKPLAPAAVGSSSGEPRIARPAPPAAAPAVGELDRQVQARLDEIKDTLLRLEIGRQAGSISDAEYAAERGRTEKLLRDFLHG